MDHGNQGTPGNPRHALQNVENVGLNPRVAVWGEGKDTADQSSVLVRSIIRWNPVAQVKKPLILIVCKLTYGLKVVFSEGANLVIRSSLAVIPAWSCNDHLDANSRA